MTKPTDPLREEHRAMRLQLRSIRGLADRIDSLASDEVDAELREVAGYLDNELLPHTLAEDAVLYPVIALTISPADSTATMSRDHLALALLAHELNRLRRDVRDETGSRRGELQRVLYVIEALASLHLDKEEEIFLPLLDAHLTDAVADDLFASMHSAAHSARRAS